MQKTKSINKSFFGNKIFITVFIFAVMIVFGWNIYQNSTSSVAINKISTNSTPGCYYSQVQCVKEPCEPVLVCPAPTSSPRMCTMEAGKCVSKNNQCLSYTNGCEKADKCSQPLTRCTMDDEDVSLSSSDPCYCPPGARCKMSALCNSPEPKPLPSNNASKILNFSASSPCGPNKFSNIQYDCTGEGFKSYTNGSCTNILLAMKAIQSVCNKGIK